DAAFLQVGDARSWLTCPRATHTLLHRFSRRELTLEPPSPSAACSGVPSVPATRRSSQAKFEHPLADPSTQLIDKCAWSEMPRAKRPGLWPAICSREPPEMSPKSPSRKAEAAWRAEADRLRT